MKKILYTIISLILFGSIPMVGYAAVTFPVNGGTGISTIPTFGQVLVGNSSGVYTLTATSSLGITGTGGGALPDWNEQTNFAALSLTPTTTIAVWIKGALYASSTLNVVGNSSFGTIISGVWNGTAIANANLANSTISGISLGSNLGSLTALDGTLNFSGSYNGSAATTIGLNLGNANVWTASTTFQKQTNMQGASTTVLSSDTICLTADICRTTWPTGGGSGTVTSGLQGQNTFYNANGTTVQGTSTIFIAPTSNVGIGATTTPWATLSVQGLVSQTQPLFAVSTTTITTFLVNNVGNILIGTNSSATLDALTVQDLVGNANIVNFKSSSGTSQVNLSEAGVLTTKGIQSTGADTFTAGSNAGVTAVFRGSSASQTGDITQWFKNNGGTQFGEVTAKGTVGFGTTSPEALLSLATSTTAGQQFTTPFFSIASTSGAVTTTLFKLDQVGHMVINSGAAPVVSTCGTNPSVSGDDTHGTVTVGSGVVTACTVTFAQAYSTAPKWIGIETNSVLSSGVTAKSTTAFTVGFSATLGSGTFDYLVIQ